MFARSFALKHIARGGRVIVLDRSTGHWDDLVAAVPGAIVHRVLLDSGFRINPWELPRHVGEPSQTKLEYLLDLHTLIVGELHGGYRPSPRRSGRYWKVRAGRSIGRSAPMSGTSSTGSVARKVGERR